MTKRLSFRVSLPTMILLAVVAGLVASQAWAFHRLAVLSPAVVATVDLEKVFVSLEAKKKADEELKKLGEGFEAERTQKKTEVENLQAELEAYAPGSDKHRQAEEKYMYAAYQYSGFVETCKLRLEAHQARKLKALYDEIKAAAAKMARANGYDLVLVDDSKADFEVKSEEDVTRQISARRMLHGNPTIDVTQELVNQMNADFAAGQ